RLRTEVLSQIFYHCLPEFGEISPPSQLEAPTLLTRICRRWMDVVGMPSFWCKLTVEVDYRDWQREEVSAMTRGSNNHMDVRSRWH
ncbi:hypothetical protein DFH29DRAFT_801673, partial [Suillus ampliporus]